MVTTVTASSFNNQVRPYYSHNNNVYLELSQECNKSYCQQTHPTHSQLIATTRCYYACNASKQDARLIQLSSKTIKKSNLLNYSNTVVIVDDPHSCSEFLSANVIRCTSNTVTQTYLLHMGFMAYEYSFIYAYIYISMYIEQIPHSMPTKCIQLPPMPLTQFAQFRCARPSWSSRNFGCMSTPVEVLKLNCTLGDLCITYRYIHAYIH